MDDDKPTATPESLTLPWKVVGVVIWGVLVAVLGGIGSDTIDYWRWGEARRPAPFTKADGERLADRITSLETEIKVIDSRIDSIERTDERIDRRIDYLPHQEWRKRIERLEWHMKQLDPQYKSPWSE